MTFLELEKKCKKRKLFKIFKIIFLVLFAVIIFLLQYLPLKKETVKKRKTIKKEIKINKKIKTNKKISKDVNITKIAIKPKVKEVKKLPKETLKLIIDLNISSQTKQIPPPQKLKKTEKTQEKNISKKETLLKTTTLPSFQTCIKLSQKYYNEKNYLEAFKWAKNANLQNNKDPQSWIMSAKALYSLGKKEEALKILKIYYNYHKDKTIKKLIKEFNEN